MAARRRLQSLFEVAAIPAIVLIAWEVAANSGWVSGYLLPPFSAVVARILDTLASGEILAAAGETLKRLAISYVIAGALGVTLGILMARVRFIRWLLDPIVSIGFPAPKIAFLPIFILWFGVFDAPKIIMAIVSCIFPVIAGTWAGTQGVDKHLIWSAQNLGARPHELLWQVVLPAALPPVFTALQVALPIAFIVVIVTEMLTGGGGLGGSMIEGARLADPVRVFANLIVIGLLGFAAMKLLQIVRRRILVWHEEVQKQEGPE